MDISFKTEFGRFNYRVCAIITKDNKILAMHNEKSPYFYLPGGRVSFNETAEDALMRELKEELCIEAKIIRPLWVNQSFFTEDTTDENFHEICIYFLVDVSHTNIIERGERFRGNELHHVHEFEWLKFERLEKEYFYPLFIKEKIFNLPHELTLHTEYE